VSRESPGVFPILINSSCARNQSGFFRMAHRAALPQVILAQWYDLYDNANRAEYRGIGIYGNRGVAPDIDAEEFAAALSRVVGDGPEAEGYRSRALEIRALCQVAGGRRAAVDRILELTTQQRW